MKIPHIPLYTGDWMKDTELSLCAPATRGVWIDLLCAMHEHNRCGELSGTSDQLARLARCSTSELEAALTDLQTTNAAVVDKFDDSWVIANRRMKREGDMRQKRAEAGSKGGSKSASKREQYPSTDALRVLEEFCTSIGLPASDGTACFYKWQANGWTNSGRPMKDWRATIHSWRLHGYLPSQKNTKNGAGPTRSMSSF